MKKTTIALGIALQLASPQGVFPAELEQTSRIIETALALPPESAVVLKTRSRESLKGRLASVTEGALTLRMAVGESVATRTIPYSEITSLRRTDKPMSPAKAALLTLGILYGIGVIGAAFLNH